MLRSFTSLFSFVSGRHGLSAQIKDGYWQFRRVEVSRPATGTLWGQFVSRCVNGGGRMIAWPRVVLLGDSITQFAFEADGWGATLADRLVRKCDIINRGLSGYNTRWAKIVLPRLITRDSEAENTIAVIIFFGANDCSLKDENPQQHISLAEYRENLKNMIQYLKSVNITEDKIVLITPPPLEESAWEQQCLTKGCKLNRLNSVAGEYAHACVEVAKCCGTSVLDLWTLMQKDKQDFSTYLSDGLHLSKKGNDFVAAQLWSVLEEKLGTLPLLLPYWADVDRKNPEASLLEASAWK
uniref:Isoamyl acetate-hydrolyzing esterase 1 homolog n=1 Tax=Geotrypetes seraphini TaxID=260995 RepID=A0A6P8Q7N6_GEOSA|nr:isoamyl acetate-hydrolyzing esterase 1 homolog [Geotrypetes seraphini]